MYERMFQNPDIRDLFNQSHHGETGSQPKALAAAVVAYARNIDNLGALASRVERIAQKHVGLNILPEHYPAVAESLLGAIKDVLGEAATDEILTAWGEAYWLLADVLIAREKNIYHELAAGQGGWNGWRDFTVERPGRRARSSAPSCSSRRTVVRCCATVRASISPSRWMCPGRPPQTELLDLLRPQGRSYRISVKREARPGVPAGMASNWLHEQAGPGTVLRVAPPAGDFFLDEASDGPVVLLSGGVGLTPMMSMLEALYTPAAGGRLGMSTARRLAGSMRCATCASPGDARSERHGSDLLRDA